MSIQFKFGASRTGHSEVRSVWNRDYEWWAEHLRWYRALAPDADIPTDAEVDAMFASTFSNVADHSAVLARMGEVVDFWNDHPGAEELLCK